MRRRDQRQGNVAKVFSGLVVAAMLVAATIGGKLLAASAAGSTSQSQALRVTERDQVELALTVYNSNVALVRDVREVTLPEGNVELRYEDVAASMNPATVHLRTLDPRGRLSVLEQQFEYDLLDPQKLLQKYVGREVTLVRKAEEAGTTKWVETKALLLADNGGPVWKIGNEIVTGIEADSYRFPELPETLYTRPTLLWTLGNRGPRTQKIETTYLTSNVNWSADYILTVSRDEKTAELNGWVTLENKSGTAFKNARLQLVAGELHRAGPQGVRMAEREGMVAGAAAAPQPFAQESFSEYHLYTLDRRTTIQDKESKQISLLSASGIPIGKKYLVAGEESYFQSSLGPGNATREPVKMIYGFKNDEASGLGMPLPAGTVRIYAADSQGNLEFAGEDTIRHTAKDERVEINAGNAFDIACERKQTDYRKLSANLYEMEFEITLRNHKETQVTVEVREPIGGDWEVLRSNYKWRKLAAQTIGFDVPVEQDGTATLDYRVQVRH